MRVAAPTIRFGYIFFYFAAGWWKWNEGFMSPETSCAPIYLIALLERNVPASLLHPAFLAVVTAIAPTLILLVELIIPFLLWLEVRSGIVFASLFHLAIAITPPPVRSIIRACVRWLGIGTAALEVEPSAGPRGRPLRRHDGLTPPPVRTRRTISPPSAYRPSRASCGSSRAPGRSPTRRARSRSPACAAWGSPCSRRSSPRCSP